MFIKIIISVIIASYVGYLIYKQVRKFKVGNYCGSCSGCPAAARCAIKKPKNGPYKIKL